MSKKVKVRFAPSPTGGLHFGGIRTALFNYLFAKKMGGDFLLRIEDTDQKRFDPNAENHIFGSLEWLGLIPDESPIHGGVSNYRQSEREYKTHIQYLIDNGHAYYAFDTDKELDVARERWKALGVKGGYGVLTRDQMNNSLTLPKDTVDAKIADGEPYVIRFKMPKDTIVRFEDGVRGWVAMDTRDLDDKVLMKSNGIPTYHGANTVDDHLMQITHVVRGEEWLASTPLHVLLYQAFGWETPKFYHLPLILDKDGKKFSKRTAIKLGISIFALSWTGMDEDSGEVKTLFGFKELGYEPEALLNYLVLLGWHPSKDDNEILSISDMIEKFDLDKINKSGAKFDLEKLNSINAHYVRSLSTDVVLKEINADTSKYDSNTLERIVGLIKERAVFRKDFAVTAKIFFSDIEIYENLDKWDDTANEVFKTFVEKTSTIDWKGDSIKQLIFDITAEKGIKIGKVMPALRVALTGGGAGPDLMTTCEIFGKDETLRRLNKLIK